MITPKRLFAPAQVPAAGADLYTAGSNLKCILKKLTFSNTAVGAHTITLYVIPSAGAATDATTIRKTKTLAAGEVWEAFEVENHILESGDKLRAVADADSVITAMGSGLEVTN